MKIQLVSYSVPRITGETTERKLPAEMAAKVSEYVFSSGNKENLRIVSESSLPRLS